MLRSSEKMTGRGTGVRFRSLRCTSKPLVIIIGVLQVNDSDPYQFVVMEKPVKLRIFKL
jgi:hypothetical protein